MVKKIAFVTYYNKDNIFSFNAIIAAIEINEIIKDIKIYYIRDHQKLFDKLPEILDEYEIVIIGFSIFTVQIWDISDIVQKLRKKYRNRLLLIAGGPHPSGDPKGTLGMGFDVVFIGESERSIVEYMKSIQKKDSFKNIEGIAYLDEDMKFYKNKKNYTIDLNEYPPFPLINTKYGSIEITRGCPYMCYFCQTSFMMGNKARYRSIESICKYIKILKKENLTDIRFITPNAFSYGSDDGKSINMIRLEELLSKARAIIGPKGRIFFGTFPSEVRPEHVNKETLNLLKKYTNNDNIVIGAQSGSQRVLDLCNRGHNVNDIFQAVRLTKKIGFTANVDFIFGLPKETNEDRKETLQVMKELIEIGAKIHAHYFIPLPQTPFSRAKVKRIDKKTEDFLRDFNFRGKIFGSWKKQFNFSLKISKESTY